MRSYSAAAIFGILFILFLGSVNSTYAELTPDGGWDFKIIDVQTKTVLDHNNQPFMESDVSVQFTGGSKDEGTVYVVVEMIDPDQKQEHWNFTADMKKNEIRTLEIKHELTKSGTYNFTVEIRTPYGVTHHVFETLDNQSHEVDEMISTFKVTDDQDSRKTTLVLDSSSQVSSKYSKLNLISNIADDKYEKVLIKNEGHIIKEMEPIPFNIDFISKSGEQGFETLTIEYILKGQSQGYELNLLFLANVYAQENIAQSSFNDDIFVTLLFQDNGCENNVCIDFDRPDFTFIIIFGITMSSVLLVCTYLFMKKVTRGFELLQYGQEEFD